MQITNAVNAVIQEDCENPEQIKEVIKEKKSIRLHNIPWLFIQLCVCLIAVGGILILKELSPSTFDDFKERYSHYIEQTLLIEDGEIIIVDGELSDTD